MILPPISPTMTAVEAGYALVDAGFAVLPVDAGDKHAGSVLRVGWPNKTGRTRDYIDRWWGAGQDYAMAVHTGACRPPVVVVDADDAAKMPPDLMHALTEMPFTSSRDNDPERGHYWATVPAGRDIGASTGGLKGNGVDIRAGNSVAVAWGRHKLAAEGGRYLTEGGELPELPEYIACRLRDRDAAAQADDEQVAAFLEGLRPAGWGNLPTDPVKNALDRHLPILAAAQRAKKAGGAGRHQPGLDAVLDLIRLGEQGWPGVREALNQVRGAFLAGRESDWAGRTDWASSLRGAVGKVTGQPTPEADRVRDPAGRGGVGALLDTLQRRRDRMLGASPAKLASSRIEDAVPTAVPTEDFPIEALPEPMRLIVADLCRTGPDAPAALFAPQALAVLSAALGGHVWARAGAEVTTLVTLYVATFSEAASGKSFGYDRLMTPLRSALRDAADIEEPDRRRRVVQRNGARARLEAATRKYEDEAKGWEDDASRPAVQAMFDEDRAGAADPVTRAQEALDALPPIERFDPLLGTNVTPEALVKRANGQGGVLAIMDDEPGSMATMTGYRYGGAADLDPLLHGYDGAPVKLVRKEAESAEIESLRLTIGIMGQPGTRDGLLKMLNVEGRGLLARWLWASVPDVAGLSLQERPEPDPCAGNAWDAAVAELVRASRTHPGDVTISFDGGATGVVKAYAMQVRRDQSRQDGIFGASSETRSWASRSVQLLVRIAVIFLAVGDPGGFREREVTEIEVVAALHVVTWARGQALAMLAPAEHVVSTTPATERAWDALVTHPDVEGGAAFTAAAVRERLRRKLGDGSGKADARELVAFLDGEVARGRLLDLGRIRAGAGSKPVQHYRLTADAT